MERRGRSPKDEAAYRPQESRRPNSAMARLATPATPTVASERNQHCGGETTPEGPKLGSSLEARRGVSWGGG